MRSRKRMLTSEHDGVLDMMFNVVGILVILTAVAQFSANDIDLDRDRRDVADLDELEDVLRALERDRQRLQALLATARKRWNAAASRPRPAPLDAEQVRKDLALLQAEARRRDVIEIPADLPRQAAEAEAQLPLLETALALAVAATQDLRARLETKTTAVATAGGTAALPNPDPDRAKGKKVLRFLCKDGKVYPHPSDVLFSVLSAELKKFLGARLSWSARDLGPLRRAHRHFETTDVGDRNYRVKVVFWEDSRVYKFHRVFELRPDAVGETEAGLWENDAAFRKAIAGADPARTWVRFLVYDDSFDVYLRARALTTHSGFAVGWIPFAPSQALKSSLIRSSGSNAGSAVGMPE